MRASSKSALEDSVEIKINVNERNYVPVLLLLFNVFNFALSCRDEGKERNSTRVKPRLSEYEITCD